MGACARPPSITGLALEQQPVPVGTATPSLLNSFPLQPCMEGGALGQPMPDLHLPPRRQEGHRDKQCTDLAPELSPALHRLLHFEVPAWPCLAPRRPPRSPSRRPLRRPPRRPLDLEGALAAGAALMFSVVLLCALLLCCASAIAGTLLVCGDGRWGW